MKISSTINASSRGPDAAAAVSSAPASALSSPVLAVARDRVEHAELHSLGLACSVGAVR